MKKANEKKIKTTNEEEREKTRVLFLKLDTQYSPDDELNGKLIYS